MRIKQILNHFLKIINVKSIIDEYVDIRIKKYLKKTSVNIYRQGKWQDKIEKGIDKVVIQLSSEVNMITATNSIVGSAIFYNEFEKDEVYFLKNTLKSGDVFIDIGANIGFFTLIAAEIVGKSGKIYSIEPNPSTFQILNQNIILNNFTQVESYMIALSDKQQNLNFYSFKNGYDAYNSFVPIRNDVPYDLINVKVSTLDHFLSSIPPNMCSKIKLIKIDVEGWELYVLNGGESFLKSSNSPSLLVEFTSRNAKIAGSDCKTLFKKGLDLGFKWYKISNGQLSLANIDDDFVYVNLFATKNENLFESL